jgi:hypothetical protein
MMVKIQTAGSGLKFSRTLFTRAEIFTEVLDFRCTLHMRLEAVKAFSIWDLNGV